MKRVVVRVLDVVAAAAVLGGVVVATTGGAVVAGVLLTRPEGFVIAAAVALGARGLLWKWPFPRLFESPVRFVALGVVVYVAAMGFIVVTRHQALRTHAFDLGYYAHVLWSIANGHGPATTIVPEYMSSIVRMNAWGDHFSPILYAFVPLAWLVRDPTAATLLAQTLLLGLGAVGVFLYARRQAEEGGAPEGAHIAAFFATVYLVNPSLHGMNLRDIHPAGFAIPLLIAAAAAHDAGRLAWSGALVVATAACREDAAVAVVGFAIWLAVTRRRWLAGGGLAAASVLLLALDLYLVMPYFRDGAPYHHLFRYTHLGGNLEEILTTIAARPWRWLGVIFTGPKLVYALAMLAPLGFLPLLAPRALAAAVPGLAMNVLSVDPILIHHRSQYQSFVLPFLVLAAVDGYFVLRARLRGRRLARVALGAAACFAVILTARTFNDFSVTKWRLGEDQRAAHRLMARVPGDAAVSANERLVPHLVMRRDVFVYPRGLDLSRHVIERADVLTRTPAPGYVESNRAGGWVLLERR